MTMASCGRIGPQVGPQERDHRPAPASPWPALGLRARRSGLRAARRARRPIRNPGELLLVELLEQDGKPIPAVELDTFEDLLAGPAEMDDDDPAVGRVMAAGDEAAALHPADDAGHARDRDVEGLRELAHRARPGLLEDRDDVEVDEAQRAALPALEGVQPIARTPRRQLGEQLVGELGSARGSVAGISQHDIEGIADAERMCQTHARPADPARP